VTTQFQHRNLPHLLLIAREALLEHFRPTLRKHGVTEQQWRIVRVLSEVGALPLKEIVERCQIFGSSLTGIVDRMEVLDYVRREPHPEDGRITLITLTAKARTLVATMQPLIDATYAQLEKQIGQARMESLFALLDETLAQLTAPPAADHTLP